MGLETGTYVNDLNTANATSADPKSQGDDHLRLIKSVLKNTFAGFQGLVVVTGTESQGATASDYTITVSPAPATCTAGFFVAFKATHANTGAATVQVNALGTKPLLAVDGSALKAGDIESGGLVAAFYDGTSFYLVSGNDRADRNGDTYSGTHDFTGAVLRAATKAFGSAGNEVATVDYVNNAAFQAALPAQTGKNGQVISSDGTSASWTSGGTVGQFLQRSAGGAPVWADPIQPNIQRSARESNTMLVLADNQHLIDITSGTFAQTFDASANLGNGWFCYLRNSGSGDITLTPNGVETIDGLTSYIMYPGEVRLVQCDGVALRSVVLSSFYKVFTASGNFIKPPGYKVFSGLMWPGGPGGIAGVVGNVDKTINGQSGVSAARFMIESSSLAQNSVTVIIGAGGAGGVISNPAYSQGGFNIVGQNGGSTSFGSYTITYNSISTDMPTALPSAIACGSSGGASVFYSGTWRKSEGFAGSSLLGGGGGTGVCYQYNNNPMPPVTLVGNDGIAPGGAGGNILAQSWNGGWFTNPTSIKAGNGARGELRIWGIV